jgi:predicted Fe-Mo cluster-binding NifX family protein
MRIAIPLAGGQLAPHFGHCEKFALLDVDRDKREITASVEEEAPEHQPGLLPSWLKERGVELVIVGGIGARAQSHFASASIQLLAGAPTSTAAALVQQYLAGTLASNPEACNHSGGHHGCRH